jgi:hypothetical protein
VGPRITRNLAKQRKKYPVKKKSHQLKIDYWSLTRNIENSIFRDKSSHNNPAGLTSESAAAAQR